MVADDRRCQLAISICGAGHSGSTLLGLILGSHSHAFYAGEAKKSRFVGDLRKPIRKRACKICGESCSIWSKFAPPGDPDLYQALARLSARDVIIDSSKDVSWIRDRARECAAAGTRHCLLFLQRDGRAVINSRLRKYSTEDPGELIAEWREQIEATEALCAERPAETLRLHYEELATEPERVIATVCEFVGLPYEPQMLLYQRFDHHPLGGNTGTQSVVARERPGTLAEIPDRSREYYESLRGGFRLDLRWQSEMPAEVLELFERRAGTLNQAFRWGVDR